MVQGNSETSDSIVQQARGHLGSLLRDWSDQVGTVGREIAVDTICQGLDSIPIPIIGKALSSAIRKRFAGREDSQTTQQLFEILRRMEASNENFDSELNGFGLNLKQMSEDIFDIKSHLLTQQVSTIKVLRPQLHLWWPSADNRIEWLLANVGGGSVIVDEIYLDVERWEPKTRVDFTVPAAPLNIIYLQAELSVSQEEYPLLHLNGIDPRIFSERGAGAEKFILDIGSVDNAKYGLRLRVPYLDLSADQEGILYHPQLTENPLELSFPCAPGWKEVDPLRLLNKEGVFEHMSKTFRAIGDMVEEAVANPEEKYLVVDRWAQELEIYSYVFLVPSFYHMIDRLTPVFARLGMGLGRRRETLEVSLRVLKHLQDFHPGEPYDETSPELVASLVGLAGSHGVEAAIHAVLGPGLDPVSKESKVIQILAEVTS